MSKKRTNQIDLIVELTKTKFTLKYNNSVLGFLWVLMKPFLQFVILYFVFNAMNRGNGDPNFTTNLLIGTLTYNLFKEGIMSGATSLLGMSQIILRINIPRKLAVSTSIYMTLINYVISIVAVWIITWFLPFSVNIKGVPYLIYIAALITFITYVCSLFLSIWVIKLRDLESILDLLLQLLFYGSGIFYKLSSIHGRVGDLIRINPLSVLIDASREAIVSGNYVHVTYIAGLTAFSLIMYFIGIIYFKKQVRLVAEFF